MEDELADSGENPSRPNLSNAPNDPRARLGSIAALLAASVFLSRVVGYLREMALANQLGAGNHTDAYYAAFQIPDLLNYLLAGGALSIAFLPFYSRTREHAGERAASRLFATVLGSMGAATVLATILLWLYADPLIRLQFPAFDPATQDLTIRLTRIVLPAQIFFVTGGIVRAVLMAEGRFLTHALAPLLYNACIIAGGLVTGNAEGFAWGVLVGAVLGPWLVPLIDLARTQRLWVRFSLLDEGLRRYLWLALPLMLGLSLLTVDEWYDRWFGATLGAGTVAYLGFARRLMQAPVAVVGQAVATAALPTLSKLWSAGRRQELDATLLRTLRGTVGLAFVAGAACFAFAEPLVELIYRHGRFSSGDALRVASILTIMAYAVPGWVTQQVAVRAFYAREDTWRPMLLGSGVALAAIPLYLAMGRNLGAEGLAAAGALAVSANALLTLAWARRRHGAPAPWPLFVSALRFGAIALLAGGAARWTLQLVEGEGRLTALLQLASGGLVFSLCILIGVLWVGDEASRRLLRRVGQRIGAALRGGR